MQTEREETYRGYTINAGERDLWVVTAGDLGLYPAGCNPMPGAALFPSIAQARIGIDLLIESGGDARRFWELNSWRMAEERLAGPDRALELGDRVLTLQHGQWLRLRRLAVECGMCGEGFKVPEWAAGLKSLFGEGLAKQLLAGPEVWTLAVCFDGSAFGTLTRYRFSGRYGAQFNDNVPAQLRAAGRGHGN